MTTCIPTPRETESDFVQRAHGALADEFPNADVRNRIVFDAWREAKGESEEEKAAHAKFPDDQYAHIENVPVFKEHEYPWMPRKKDGSYVLDDEGQPVVRKENYDFDSLKAICDNLNFGIADTGEFIPLTDKHNPKKGSEESKPRTMGFAGPFGMGMIGNKEPKWGIIAKQEHWFKDKAHMARELPRRSPEVYLGRPMEDRILDPITVLGADTPALPMGIHYSEVGLVGQESDEQFAYYSGPPILAHYDAVAAAPTFPGGGNSCPLEEVRVKKTYSEEPPVAPVTPAAPVAQTQGKSSMISTEDANTIIQALMETEPLQWVIGQMQASKAPKQDDPDAKTATEPPVDAGAVPPAAPPAVPEVPPNKQQLSEETAPGLTESKPQEPPDLEKPSEIEPAAEQNKPIPGKDSDMSKPEDDKKKKEETANYAEREAARDETAKYAALEQKIALLEAENAETKKQAMISGRAAKINGYRLQGFDLDVDAEIQRCSFENMPTEREFQNALDLMVHYAQRIPINITLHTPDAPIVEDRHKAKARVASRNGKTGDPDFVNTEEFTEEVVSYAQAEQAKADYVWDPQFYNRCRSVVIERRLAKTTGAAKVG